jgi:hypothetical protein
LNIPEAGRKQHPFRRKVTECKRSRDGVPSGQRKSPHHDSIEDWRCQMEKEKEKGTSRMLTKRSRHGVEGITSLRDDISMLDAFRPIADP